MIKTESIKQGNIISIIITLISCWFLIDYLLPDTITGMKFFGEGTRDIPSKNIFYSTIVGLAVGYLISAFEQMSN